jgi:RHH-type proline utilization regulon transcriptional repressor/proline dehydrogenase/delta 1-pyrroline-5-carboxylate dehydrogenase
MSDLATRAVALAAEILTAANRGQTSAESRRAQKVRALIADPAAKSFSMALTDRAFRSRSASRFGDAFRGVIRAHGLPRGFSLFDRGMLAAASVGSRILPELVLPAVRHRLRAESDGVILPAEPEPLGRYLKERYAEGTRTNLNQLGEAILGEEDAADRHAALLGLLARRDVDYISVKISAILSQVNVAAWEHTLALIKERLRPLYRAAQAGGKFVNLDMEEYRDLALTLAAFRDVLDEPEFLTLRAGIVLQAYLPDAWNALQELTTWAQARCARGGAPIKVRLVKGANLAMEQVDAELHGWNVAPYTRKADTDANFKRMLDFACGAENARAVRLGVGSHNLFDVALTLVLRAERGVSEFVEIEMLEGMANHQARAVHKSAGGLLVYAPIVHQDDYGSALAYLIRRLDENTQPENFLHDLFGLAPGSEAWERQRERFVTAWEAREAAPETSHRATLPQRPAGFSNEPDTDWTQPAARAAIRVSVPLPGTPEALHASPATAAKSAQPDWARRSIAERAELLRNAAKVMAAARFETIALLREEGHKALADADAEVSEAIDFARYYAETFVVPEGLAARPLGVVLITPPWNFPYAIPAGGVLAALMAGNAVILKPAPETVGIARLLATQLWEAGIPRDVLLFHPCADGEVGKALITDPCVDAIVLTGAYETARMFQGWRPSLRLYAETSGKNSVVVTALADRDLAAKDIVRSAFGHNGQKCSAASLAILEAEVYDDPAFRRQLRDAAASLPAGPAEDPASLVTPLIRAPGEALLRGLTQLDDGEEWLLEPRDLGGDLWTPGIRLGVQAGSWFHQTECFGPVLGLMRARNLAQAVQLQNATAYGLTAGIHSLDESEIAWWREHAQAGNLYINRPITGAIVRRQPFGGWKRSCIGPGAKAGGPNYTALFCDWQNRQPVSLVAARESYGAAWAGHFAVEHDPSGLACESNVFRYRPCRGVILRLSAADPQSEGLARLAAEICGVPLTISRATEESDEAFARRLPTLSTHAEFLRTVETPSDTVLRAAQEADLNWICATLSGHGRLELTRWLREQAVSQTLHRYGNCARRNVAAKR